MRRYINFLYQIPFFFIFWYILYGSFFLFFLGSFLSYNMFTAGLKSRLYTMYAHVKWCKIIKIIPIHIVVYICVIYICVTERTPLSFETCVVHLFFCAIKYVKTKQPWTLKRTNVTKRSTRVNATLVFKYFHEAKTLLIEHEKKVVVQADIVFV